MPTTKRDLATDAGDNALLRQPPHNIEIEQALLGAVLINNDLIERLDTVIAPDHFFAPLHGRIFETARKLQRAGKLASPLTLKTTFEGDPDFQELGGFEYLRRLVEDCPSVVNGVEFARAIHDLATRRRLIAVGEEIVNGAYMAAVDLPPQDQIEEAERQLYTLSESGRFGGGFKTFKMAATAAIVAAEAAHKRRGKIAGISTGFEKLDWRLGGLQRSDLLILAGRPGMGKTALATNIGVHVARARMNDQHEGGVVAFFSLEMSAEQLASRIMAQHAQIPVYKIRSGQVPNDKFADLVDSVHFLEELPFFIDDSPGLSIAQVAARARRMKRDKRTGLDLIIIDYLQLLSPSGVKRYENRVQEITDITKGLKSLAKELDVPVLALSQLNRGVDARDDKRPVLSDLRESGSIEQDADIVMFVYREEYYLKNREPDQKSDDKAYRDWAERSQEAAGKAEVMVEKHRHGATGSVKLAFNGELTRFDNLIEDEAEAAA